MKFPSQYDVSRFIGKFPNGYGFLACIPKLAITLRLVWPLWTEVTPLFRRITMWFLQYDNLRDNEKRRSSVSKSKDCPTYKKQNSSETSWGKSKDRGSIQCLVLIMIFRSFFVQFFGRIFQTRTIFEGSDDPWEGLILEMMILIIFLLL